MSERDRELVTRRAFAADCTRLRYQCGGTSIYVDCPWGDESGHIPPPTIKFGDMTFVYVGDTQVSPERGVGPVSDDIELIEPQTIDEARLQMVLQLHRAVFGDSWARPESPGAVWADLLDRIDRARRQFQR